MRILAILTACLLAGCATTDKFDFPSDIASLCHHARNQAKACIEAKGMPLPVEKPCRVVKRVGQVKIGGTWAWYEPAFNMQPVGGTCSGKEIQIASDPATGAVHFPFLQHEMAHYWLIGNYQDWGHAAKYKGCFANWKEPPASYRATFAEEAERVHYDVVEGVE